ncbi:GGDEF domain-containing protein [Lysinibacillus agricola]|uniref:GGDEF domain-containing protein n=1 Tax=Lysinibacillus agricola TaxID=2590012 RepID=A0ABX7ASM2_9BACI|nr:MULTISPECIES: GGDEF domain-containing protein [Lysinibacillus]KOS60527.1 diguanylate cyclase [Lysinibacillus sp. FJAT-14222]QQP12775.1 GGDEF domain-containing protein [Lysinibacillus agricola]
MKIGEVIENVPCIDEFVKNKEVDLLFTSNPSLRSVVVVRDDKPIGQITRTHFYQKIGTRYGYNLFMGRQNQLIIKENPLVVDRNTPITEVSTEAMRRRPEDLYDDVIVTRNDVYYGVVSIRELLLKLVDTQVAIASFLNPLSSLPGNKLIEEKLEEALQLPQYSLIYFDLDHFKSYNDTYGFNKGDKILLYLTDVLKRNIVGTEDFLGHVGGDDFVAILSHYEAAPICQRIIDEFDAFILSFYDLEDLTYLEVQNRTGKLEPLSCTTLSIAVITNQYQQFESVDQLSDAVTRVKKQCKKISGSCYLINDNEKEAYLVH